MDLLHIELAHEGDDFMADDLAWNHDWKTRRIRDHKICRNQRGSVPETSVHLLAEQLHMLAVCGFVGHEKCLPDISLARVTCLIWSKGVVKRAEVRQVWHVLHQRLDSCGKLLCFFQTPLSEFGLELR